MMDGEYSGDHVAPLRIRKSQKDLRQTSQDVVKQQHSKALPAEPPPTPRPRFQNFLRASYPFQPQDQFSSTSVTIPLATGDIVLVHSIHTNGWADGTKLESGVRGWLPTNYCEPYDYATMRPLLKALTEFWDIIRNDGESPTDLCQNHDYMRGVVAGVRFLLEKSSCLTRDATTVRAHDNIRKIRKGLLSDLSLLVKASKSVQLHGINCHSNDFEAICDDILLKAFQVVTRAVHFFDVYSEEISFSQGSGGRLGEMYPLNPGSPVQVHNLRNGSPGNDDGARPYFPNNALQRQPRTRPASINRPPTLTHRMSYSAHTLMNTTGNLASEQLSDTYDAFLGVLASFLGSHMQSRSSSELLLTTQQAVKSCRKLLEVVEIILEHDLSASEALQHAKDSMYDKITNLVHAAREVFRPLHVEDDDMIFLPGEGTKLVNAATACVSGAGRCVAKARMLLEEIGDFELELSSECMDLGSPTDVQSLESVSRTVLDCSFTPDESRSNSRRPSQPRLDIPQIDSLQSSVSAKNTTNVNSASKSIWSPLTDTTGSPTSGHSDLSAEIRSHDTTAESQGKKALTRAMHGSESTLVSSRNSLPSFISETSTRATSPETHAKTSPRTLEEERDEGEDALMEYHFAHELVINNDGRIIGGSLNAIIERLTSHEAAPDSGFVAMVYLTFRLFATPVEFAEALAYRFNYVEQSPRISHPVRLRVSNVLKGWLESHWRHDRDEAAIVVISNFIRTRIVPILSGTGNRLLDLLQIVISTHAPAVPRLLSSMGKTNTASSPSSDTDQPVPPPILSKNQLNSLKLWKMGGSGLSVLDFDPMELARQLTIKTSSIFCSILPEELLGCEFMKDSSSLAVNVRALTTFSNDLANLVVDSILLVEDVKKRAAVIKQWIKIEAKLLELHNYETLITINASLMLSTVQRLKKTWECLGQKTKTTMEEINRVVDHSKNYASLRQRIQNLGPPCLPYVGIYRTDLTFIDQGCQSTRELTTAGGVMSVVNIDKHSKTAKIISDLQRFQVDYKLTPIDELQTWLQDECIRVRAAGERNFQNQYRRSLLLEPKVEQQNMPKGTKLGSLTSMSSFAGKDKFDFLSWTHNAKERNDSVSSA